MISWFYLHDISHVQFLKALCYFPSVKYELGLLLDGFFPLLLFNAQNYFSRYASGFCLWIFVFVTSSDMMVVRVVVIRDVDDSDNGGADGDWRLVVVAEWWWKQWYEGIFVFFNCLITPPLGLLEGRTMGVNTTLYRNQ